MNQEDLKKFHEYEIKANEGHVKLIFVWKGQMYGGLIDISRRMSKTEIKDLLKTATESLFKRIEEVVWEIIYAIRTIYQSRQLVS